MSNPTDQFTRNKFVDKMMSIIPQDPLTQSLYMYVLTTMVFLGLCGYSITSWWIVISSPFTLKPLFSSLFMTAIAMMSVVGLKQTRDSYHMIKMMYSQQQVPVQVEDPKKMLEGFDEKKV